MRVAFSMIASSRFFYHLKEFGLNNYESKLWIVLLSKGIATTAELAELSGVPRSRAYDVLEGLEKKGFVMTKIGKPIKYMALEPKQVIERLKNNIRQTSNERLKFMEKIQDDSLFKQLTTIYEQGESKTNDEESFNLLKGRKNIYDKIATLIERAENQIVFYTSPNGLLRKQREFSHLLEKAAFRGVKISFFIDGEVPAAFSMKKYVSVFSSQRKARHVIVDEHLVIFFSSDKAVQHYDDKAFWILSPFLVNTFSSLHKRGVA